MVNLQDSKIFLQATYQFPLSILIVDNTKTPKKKRTSKKPKDKMKAKPKGNLT